MDFLRYIIAAFLFLACAAGDSPAQDRISPEEPPPTKPRPNRFLVDITSIYVNETADGPTFTMEGISRFPDGTMALVSIKFFEVTIPGTSRFVKIENGCFEVVYKAALWKGKKFFPGNYEFEVQVDPTTQSRKIRTAMRGPFGVESLSKAYRNKYVTVGTREEKKKEEDKFRAYYLNAITALWGKNTLFDQLEEKHQAASAKFRRKFRKLDKDGKLQIDPNNKNAYLVDEKEFRKYLRDNPNEFYDRTGKFKEQAWRDWLDDTWHAEWKKLHEKHEETRKGYVAIPWPEQHNDLEKALKIVKNRSAEHSIQLYKWNNLPLNEKDKLDDRVDDLVIVPGKTAVQTINKIITDTRHRLRLDDYRRRMKEKEKKLELPEPPEPAAAEKREPAREPQGKSEPAEKETDEIEEETLVRVEKRQPTPKKKPREDLSDFAYYFLAILGIIAVAVIMKRKV